MAFDPVHLVHPKTGTVVEATTAVDLTNFRFNDGYVPVETAELLVNEKEGQDKYPKLVEGLKQVDAIKSERAAEKAPTSKPASGGAKATAKSGTDASGNQVGVN